MTTAPNKKVIIPRNKITEVSKDNIILLRYRVIFDKTKYSDFSQMYSVYNKDVVQDTNASVVLSNNVVQISWSNVNDFYYYDIFVKYQDEQSYRYRSTVNATTFSFVPDQGKTVQSIIVQLACSKKDTPYQRIRVFEKAIA